MQLDLGGPEYEKPDPNFFDHVNSRLGEIRLREPLGVMNALVMQLWCLQCVAMAVLVVAGVRSAPLKPRVFDII